MDENAHANRPQQPLIQQNPHLAECPDFGDDSFEALILTMVGPDRTRDQAIDSLRTAWHNQNNRKKALWDAQILANQERQNDANAQNAPVEEPDQAGIDLDDTRRKPKLGAFAATASIGDEITAKPSTFAINKLRDMKYIELYCFSPAGCRDHANQRLSTADEAFAFTYGISPDGSSGTALTLKPTSALAHPGKIIPDENLTWEQVRDAKACYLNHIHEAKWNAAHVNALVSFFVNLDNHPYNDTPEGKQALVWYQAHVREDWHRKLGTTESYNLAILNKTLLADFKKKATDIAVQQSVAQVSPSCPRQSLPLTPNPSLITCTPMLLPHLARTGHHAHSGTHTLASHPPPTLNTTFMHRTMRHHAPRIMHMRHHATCTTHTRRHVPCTSHMRHHAPCISHMRRHAPCTTHASLTAPPRTPQLRSRLDDMSATMARPPSTNQNRTQQSRTKSGRYQPYSTSQGPDTTTRPNDENPRSTRPTSTHKRNKVGNSSPSTNDHNFTANTDPRGLSACAICLSRNPHDVTQCDANTLWDGHTPSFARKGDKGAKLRNSSTGDSLCLDWNLPRSCNSTSHISRHRCSGCGSSDHGAQTCRLAQPRIPN
jgi:hypothetical protein